MIICVISRENIAYLRAETCSKFHSRNRTEDSEQWFVQPGANFNEIYATISK